jgi:hypothetical protein
MKEADPFREMILFAESLDRDFRSAIEKPDWNVEHALDWRNFIPGELRLAWEVLEEQARVAAFIVAAEAANWTDEHYPPAR